MILGLWHVNVEHGSLPGETCVRAAPGRPDASATLTDAESSGICVHKYRQAFSLVPVLSSTMSSHTSTLQ